MPPAVAPTDVSNGTIESRLGQTRSARTVSSFGRGPATDELTAATTGASVTADAGVQAGSLVGRFLILGELGRGGMGSVHLGYDRDLDRKVAVKVLHYRQDDKDGQARALREAQAMAKLSHPNVVAVYEVGTFDDRVFFAMEFVEGMTLRAWVRARPRTWRESVQVMLQAGRGIAAAHEAGLVHRDIKPSNIMIDNKGRVRVTDFGVASYANATPAANPDQLRELLAAGSGISVDTSLSGSPAGSINAPLTRAGVAIGTPAYMPPEQARGAADAKSDQYSYAATLYELLYGKRPLEGLDKPGVPKWLRRLVLRGLNLDPQLRYPSMDALLAELGRDRWARFRRAGLAAALLGAIGVGVGVPAFSGGGAARPCRDADSQFAEVWSPARSGALQKAFVATGRSYAADVHARVSQRLDAYARGWIAMRTEACEATQIRGVQSAAAMDLRMSCLDRRRAEFAALVDVLSEPSGGESPGDRGAADVLDRAIQAAAGLSPIDHCADLEWLGSRIPPPDAPEVRARIAALEELLDRANAMASAGRYREGLPLAVQAAADAGSLEYWPIRAQSLQSLAVLQQQDGQAAAAEATLLEAIPIAARALDDDLVAKLWSMLIGVVGRDEARPDAALAWKVAAEAAVRRTRDSPLAEAELEHNLGNVLYHQGRYREAQTHVERALELRRQTLSADHPDLAGTLNNLANILADQGELEQAGQQYERALTLWEAALGADHPRLASAVNNLGSIYYEQKRYPEARRLYERALRLRESTLGPEHPSLASVVHNLGEVARHQGRLDDAVLRYRRALALWERAGNPNTAHALTGLGEVALSRGDAAAAVPLLERALSVRTSVRVDPTLRAYTQFALARALWESAPNRARALELAKAARATYRESGERGADRLAEVDQWLRGHAR